MPNFWVMAPFNGDKARQFDQIWQYDRRNNVISIGWDVGQFDSSEQMERKYWLEADRQNKEAGQEIWGKHGLRQLKRFWFEVKPGDKIVARRGRGKVIGLGVIADHPRYNREMASEQAGTFSEDHAYFLPVRWIDFEKELTPYYFPMYTLCPLKEIKFREITEGIEF